MGVIQLKHLSTLYTNLVLVLGTATRNGHLSDDRQSLKDIAKIGAVSSTSDTICSNLCSMKTCVLNWL